MHETDDCKTQLRWIPYNVQWTVRDTWPFRAGAGGAGRARSPPRWAMSSRFANASTVCTSRLLSWLHLPEEVKGPIMCLCTYHFTSPRGSGACSECRKLSHSRKHNLLSDEGKPWLTHKCSFLDTCSFPSELRKSQSSHSNTFYVCPIKPIMVTKRRQTKRHKGNGQKWKHSSSNNNFHLIHVVTSCLH